MATKAWPNTMRLLAILVGLLAIPTEAFYIPGWSIRSYKDGDAIPLLVNKVFSDHTQLSFAYYDLPFVCPPMGKNHHGSNFMSGQNIALNLGEVLRGDRIVTSDVELVMGQDLQCKVLCNKNVTRIDLKRARELIKDNYVAEWIVDNLPGATSYETKDKSRKQYSAGFKMGFKVKSGVTARPMYFINNHVTIVLRYRKAPGRDGEQGRKVIVGFEVYPKSITSENRPASGCPADIHHPADGMPLHIPPGKSGKSKSNKHSSNWPAEESEDLEDGRTINIPYTYSVYFREDETIEWSRRWDLYFVDQNERSKIHWLAIINSIIISSVLSGIVGVILTRTIRGDIQGRAGDNVAPRAAKSAKSGDEPALEGEEEMMEDTTGWKLLHGDVFRAPKYSSLLAPLIGSGMQLMFMALGLLILSSIGVLNPSFRGGFVSVGVGLFTFAGIFSGYFSGRLYKTFGGEKWRRNTLITAILFPGLLFVLVFVLNLFVWAQASSTAIPFTTLLAIVMLWLCIQLPLVYLGSYYGVVRAAAYEHPTKTVATARPVPAQPWYLRSAPSALLAGLIPFAVVFVELLFVFQSMWQDKSGYYYMFGFLSVVFAIVLVTIAEVTIVTVYIGLCFENHRWWWRSFFVGAASAVWVFVYCGYYYFTKLAVSGLLSSLLFFAYSGLACAVYGLLCGTVGFVTAYAFVRRMYGAIKVD